MLPNDAMKYGDWYIVEYGDGHEEAWDTFISKEAVNACFLQSRKFLNYHPKEKYEDSSLLIYDSKGNLSAVCAGAVKYEDGKKTFFSHAGSSYGGIILNDNSFRMEKCMGILESFESHLKLKGFSRVLLKPLNPLMCKNKDELLTFCLYFKKYTEYKELNLYVDLNQVDLLDVSKGFSKLKRRTTKKCLNLGMQLRELKTKSELERFLEILTGNLEKYGLMPYQSVDDLLDLRGRFPNEIQYWGCVYEGKIVSVTMVFLFPETGCVHTHYLASDKEYNKVSPMTFIYYKMIEYYKEKGYQTVSWGISTEHRGVEINVNLTNTKEEFGSHHNIVPVFEKDF